MIKFKEIKMTNFLSTGKKGISYTLDKDAITLITGLNGHGKSLIICGIHFALFGKTFRKIKKDQIPNSLNKTKCVTEISFQVENVNYKVVRGLKPNIFEIWKNGVVIPAPANIRDYQNILETDILKFNSKTFNQIVILGSSSYIPFMELSASDRRIVIEDLLDIRLFSSMNNLVKGRIQDSKIVISEKDNQMDMVENKITIMEEHNEKIQSSNKSKKSELQGKICSLQLANDELDYKLSEIEPIDIKELKAKRTQFESRGAKILTMINGLQTKKKGLNRDVLFYNKNDACPKCHQDITPDTKLIYINKLNEKIEKIESGESDIHLKQDSTLLSLDGVITEIKKAEDVLIQRLSLTDKISKNENQIKFILEEMEREEIEFQNTDIVIAERDALQTQKTKLFSEQITLFDVKSLLDDDGVKSQIVKKYIPILNSLITKNLNTLDFNCDFIFDQDLNETIRSRGRDKFSYHSFSEGEKLRINISLMFAFRELASRKNSLRTNLLILDEFSGGVLDEEGLIGALAMIKSLDGNTFIISHEDVIKESFAQTQIIEVRKINNFTTKK